MYLVAIIIETRRRKTGTHVYGDLTYYRIAQDDQANRKNIPVLVSIGDRKSEYLEMRRTYAQ